MRSMAPDISGLASRPMRFTSLGALLLLGLGCTRSTPETNRGDAPLDLTLPGYPSKAPFALSSERGHVVLLDVWATWCEPCRESLPKYQALSAKYADKGLRIYAINVDGDAAVPQEIPKFITETGLSLPILLDTDAKLSEDLLKVKVMPTALLIDRKGVVRHVHEGFEKATLGVVVGHLEASLAEP